MRTHTHTHTHTFKSCRIPGNTITCISSPGSSSMNSNLQLFPRFLKMEPNSLIHLLQTQKIVPANRFMRIDFPPPEINFADCCLSCMSLLSCTLCEENAKQVNLHPFPASLLFPYLNWIHGKCIYVDRKYTKI